MQPGEYTATVTIEFSGDLHTVSKSWRCIEFTQTGEQPKYEVIVSIVEMVADIIRDEARKKGLDMNAFKTSVPLFVNIEPS